MKHLMRKNNSFFACCSRPGCQASLEGNLTEITKEEIQQMFDGECPYVFDVDKLEQLTGKKAIEFLKKYSEKESKGWQKVINYWNKDANKSKQVADKSMG